MVSKWSGIHKHPLRETEVCAKSLVIYLHSFPYVVESARA